MSKPYQLVIGWVYSTRPFLYNSVAYLDYTTGLVQPHQYRVMSPSYGRWACNSIRLVIAHACEVVSTACGPRSSLPHPQMRIRMFAFSTHYQSGPQGHGYCHARASKACKCGDHIRSCKVPNITLAEFTSHTATLRWLERFYYRVGNS